MSIEDSGRKKVKGEKTRQKLFDTAVQLFGQYEFDQVSVDAIVEAAGVSKGTFYIYFDSKDALIASALSEYVQHVDLDYRSHLDALPSGASAQDKLLSLIGKIADVLTGTIGYHRMKIIYRLQLTGPIDMEAVKGYNRELYKMFAEVLQQGLEAGEFATALSLDALTRHFVMAIRGISHEWCIRYPDFDLKAQALEHFKLLLGSLSK